MTTTVEKEISRLARAEERLRRQAHKDGLKWKSELENKIPEKVLRGLQGAFRKAFELLFDKGTPILEKTFQKEAIEKDFLEKDLAMDTEVNRKALLQLKANAELSHFASLIASAVEGVGLGALGVGLPDIVLFVSMLLRGCYETALRYGFEYDTPEEKYFLLTVLEGSMLKDDLWDTHNDLVNTMLPNPPTPSEEELAAQLLHTSNVLAVDMLLAKFIQGIPVVGIAGGLANPLYYRRILNYVKLKYRKRYLLMKSACA